MKNTFRFFPVLLFIVTANLSYAQTNEQKAKDKGMEALKLVDKGKFEEGIKLFEEAQKLDKDNINYPYEIAYAYYGMQEYKKAIRILEDLKSHKNVTDLVYQLLGNSYDVSGQGDKAMKAYEAGVEKFPDSGPIYLEMGNVYLIKKDYNKAMVYYEKGIKVQPTFPSNYYWAAKIYCSSTEEIWGMIYGEIFMNLERGSKRTAEISKLLYDTYKSQIKFTSDTSFEVSFSKNATVTLEDLKDPKNPVLPYGVGVYEPTLMLSMISEKNVSLDMLDRTRKGFVDRYFEEKYNTKYPNILFDYQKSIIDAGHMAAYNHWVLMRGDEAAFAKWQADNKAQWEKFVAWFTDNKLKVDDSHKFFREQY